MRILYKTFLLMESCALFRSINSWRTVSFYSHFFFKYLTNAEYMISSRPLHWKSHWWSPIISSAYGVKTRQQYLKQITVVPLNITMFLNQEWLHTCLKRSAAVIITKTLIQCKLCLLFEIPYDLHKKIYIKQHKNYWIGNVLASDCVQGVYKNIK